MIEARDLRRKRIPRRLDEETRRFGYACVAQQDAVHTGSEHLVDHPVVGAHAGLIEAEHRQRDDDGWSTVAGWRGTAIDQAAHERAQR